MILKKAPSNRLGEICRFYIALEKHYNVNPSREKIAKWKYETSQFITKPKKGGVFIAMESNEAIGYLSYYFVKGIKGPLKNCVFLSELYIKSKYRKKGIASELIKMLFRVKLPSFVKRVTVTTSPQAAKVIQLYETLGFKIKGKTKAGNIKLEKVL